MYQNYNYYPQQQQSSRQITYPQQTTNGLKGRPVSSIEEARASSIDFDGSIFFFPDLANRRIYTKQINLDGTASLLMYELKEMPTSDFSMNNYVTREEFEMAMSQIKNVLVSQQQPQQQQKEELPQKQEIKPF